MFRGAPGQATRLANLCAVGLIVASTAWARPARATDADDLESRTTTVILVGGSLDLIPFAVGGALAANTGNQTARRAGVYAASAGFTLAPLIAHGVMDEWGRGALFASVPLACGVGLAIVMQVPGGDVLVDQGTASTRVPFWAFASLALASSAFGVLDAAVAPGRHRSHALYVVPSRVPSGATMNVGGIF